MKEKQATWKWTKMAAEMMKIKHQVTNNYIKFLYWMNGLKVNSALGVHISYGFGQNEITLQPTVKKYSSRILHFTQ